MAKLLSVRKINEDPAILEIEYVKYNVFSANGRIKRKVHRKSMTSTLWYYMDNDDICNFYSAIDTINKVITLNKEFIV